MTEREILNAIREQYCAILGDKLAGLYLHGSLAMGCFRWEVSDIDFLAVVRRPLTDPERVALIRVMLALTPSAPPKGIEMSVVTADVCRNFVHPTPYELHFSNAHLTRYQADIEGYCRELRGVDFDLAAHFAIARMYGETLWGAPVGEVFGPVPREDVLDSILRDVAEEDVSENPVYFALNLCRVLAFQREDLLLSKADGARWGLAHLPEKWEPAIQGALDAYEKSAPPPENLSEFCAWARKMVFEA